MPDFYHAPALIEGSPHVFIATPAVTLHGNHFAAMMRAMPLLMCANVAADHYLLMDCCHVDDARNTCIAKFLETPCEALIFIDADVGFPPEALLRLVKHRGDVVAGVYPRKDVMRSWPVKFAPGTIAEEGEDGVIRNGVIGVPTGFLKIRRDVIERMALARSDRTFAAFGEGLDGPRAPVIFERTFNVDGERLSGDYAFSAFARELGYTLAVDPHLPFTHAGEWRFAGRLYDDLKEKPNA